MQIALQHLSEASPPLKEIIAAVPSPDIRSTNNVFHDLMSCILEQQIHYRSSKKLFQKMLLQADITVLTPHNFSLFEKKAFEGRKFSGRKYETVLNVLDFWQQNDLDWSAMSDEEVYRALAQIKGIGKWTADMILIYTLGRPDVFAFDDYHIKQIMIQRYGLNPKSKLKAQMEELTQKWQPYRSLAFLYLLGWKDFKKAHSALR